MFSLLYKNVFNKFFAADLNCQHRLNKAISAVSTLNYSTSLAGTTDSESDRREYVAAFTDVVRSLTKYASKYELKEAVKIYEKALRYNVTTGRLNLGFTAVQTFKKLADETQLNSENIQLAQYLGWCVEMVLSFGYVLDDLEDGGLIRRGKPCWYKLEDVGLAAVNDSLMIENGVYHILKENFGQKDYYVKLLELFHESIFIGTLGQSMDLQASRGSVTNFTMDRYKTIVANKTSCFVFYLPVALAMHLCGFTDPEIFKQTREFLLQIGHYFQVENDFKDCFADPKKTGKIGTDIEKNKCSWLALVCMENASEAQKEIMRECYGKSDPVKIEQVKHLYEELKLPDVFAAYKEETINMVKTHIQQDSGAVPMHLYKIILPFLTMKNWSDAFDSSHTSD